MPPRALSPSGVLLIDKPEGPSSFGVVAEVRRRTGARTGHAGTLDPFASGLLVVLSDGLAYDHGYERAYGAADARRALSEA